MFDAADKAAPGHYAPSETALLLLDFHDLFVTKVAGEAGPATLRVAAEMRAFAKAQGIHVIHGLIDVYQFPTETCKDAARLTGIVGAMQASGGQESSVLSEGGSDNDVTFTRRPGHVSAFKSPGLEEYLQKNGIKSLILTGLSTSGCVMRTAVAATDADYVVSVISDACADPGEGVHDLMMGKILNNRGYVTTGAEFRDGFTKVAGGGTR